jgi:hypothetical protein
MLSTNHGQNIRQSSGEQLLLLAVLGPKDMRGRINRELDRRAVMDTVGQRSHRPGWRSTWTAGAA